MSTKQPRVALTLSDDIKSIYKETARLMGIPSSRLMANLLIDASPSVKALQKPLKQASKGCTGSLDDLTSILENVQEEAKRHQIDIEEQISRNNK